jgi:hydroxylaminobenzene mutase
VTTNDASRRLCWHGALLFLLGLLTGTVIPAFTNSRMGLSSHLAGVQNGMVLMLFAYLWSRLSLSDVLRRATFAMAIASMYAIWLALLLSAVFGTSRATPIAGAGYSGTAWQEIVVTVLIYAGSVAIIGATALVLHGLRSPARGGTPAAD